MSTRSLRHLFALALIGAGMLRTSSTRAADPLPSWNEGQAKQAIVAFVAQVTTPGSPDFVPVAERIATFDNDGCLCWNCWPTCARTASRRSSSRAVASNSCGRRPIAAFGNSDGDLQMLQWTAAGAGTRFCLLVHHTDAAREWAYDRQSHIGRLDKGLDEATTRGWTVVDMQRDWAAIYPPE